MSLYTKVSGAWKKSSDLYYKIAGAWKKTRMIFRKENGQWVQYFANNEYKIYALGLAQTVYPQSFRGMWLNGVYAYDPNVLYDPNHNPIVLGTGGRGYNLVTFDKYGNSDAAYNFDIFGEANNEKTGESGRMKATLDALPNGKLFCLFSFDEPRDGHLTLNGVDLLSAVIRIGGTNAVYGQTMNFRGAYLLLGQVGSPAYAENYVGADFGDDLDGSGDPKAALLCTFKLQYRVFFGASVKVS